MEDIKEEINKFTQLSNEDGFNSNEQVEDEDVLFEQIDKLVSDAKFNSTDFYAIFNLPKDTSEESIKEEYKKLCRTFHPDKHVDEIKRQQAQEGFQRLQKAYEVLMDPNQRFIYDNYGEKALSMPWKVGQLLKTPDQLREEYEKLLRKKREENLENLVKTKTKAQIQFNAIKLFQPTSRNSTLMDRVNSIKVDRAAMKHNYLMQIYDKLQLTLTGTILSKQGRGGANVGFNFRHTLSNQLTIEYGMSLLGKKVANFKSFYQPTSDSFLNTVVTTNSPFTPPTFQVTAGQQISEKVTGFINYSSGDYSLLGWGVNRNLIPAASMGVGIASNDGNLEYQAELQTGIQQTYLACNIKHKVNNRTKAVVSASLSNATGIAVSLGAERKVVYRTNMTAAVDFGFPTGVSLRLSLDRLGQRVDLPVALSNNFSLTALITAFTFPTAVWLTFDNLILSPYRRHQFQAKLEEVKELNKENLSSKRMEAETALNLLKDAAQRKLKAETDTNGLVILEAYYGRIDDTDHPTKLRNKVIDVQCQLQYLVNSSQLVLHSGYSKSHLVGFYDPCFGENKTLIIKYKFNHKIHKAIVKDKQALACPNRAHIIHS